MSNKLIITATAHHLTNGSNVTYSEYIKSTDLSLNYAATRRLRELFPDTYNNYSIPHLWLEVVEHNDDTGNETVLNRVRV